MALLFKALSSVSELRTQKGKMRVMKGWTKDFQSNLSLLKYALIDPGLVIIGTHFLVSVRVEDKPLAPLKHSLFPSFFSRSSYNGLIWV
jgi:hypothetical protein